MSTLIKYNPEAVNRALMNESGQPAAMVAAFAKSLNTAQQMRNLPVIERIKALEPVISAYYVRSQINSHAMQAMVEMMAEAPFGRLALDEVAVAFRLAASGQLFDVEFSFVPTAANFGQVLSAYIETKRRALVAAQIKLEEKAKKAEEERERANRVPSPEILELIRQQIKKYAADWLAIQRNQSPRTDLDPKAVWIYQVQDAVKVHGLLNLTEAEREAERGRAMGEGRKDARYTTGVVTPADLTKAIENAAAGIEKAYIAARLIEKNAEFFIHKF
jgi:hypothetical protein